MAVPQTVEFNGVSYRLMGSGRYYLSQSRSNEGRRHAKGLHVAVWEFYSGQTVPKGYEVHHKDGNCFNNDYSNLECLPRKEHRRATNYSTERVREHLDEIRPLTAAWHKSEEGSEWHRQHGKECMEKRPLVERTCICCGATFQAKNKYAKFCSHNCSVKYDYRNKFRIEKRVCAICGAEFETKVGSGKSGRETCSKSCQSKLLWARKREASGL